MEKLEPMDILRVPTTDEIIISKIAKWIKDSYYDKNKNITIIFKKNTPIDILNLFQNNTQCFKFQKVNQKYQIEK